jgi:hypothetical protein
VRGDVRLVVGTIRNDRSHPLESYSRTQYSSDVFTRPGIRSCSAYCCGVCGSWQWFLLHMTCDLVVYICTLAYSSVTVVSTAACRKTYAGDIEWRQTIRSSRAKKSVFLVKYIVELLQVFSRRFPDPTVRTRRCRCCRCSRFGGVCCQQ